MGGWDKKLNTKYNQLLQKIAGLDTNLIGKTYCGKQLLMRKYLPALIWDIVSVEWKAFKHFNMQLWQ